MKNWFIFLIVLALVTLSYYCKAGTPWIQDKFIIMNQCGDPTIHLWHNLDSIAVLLQNNRVDPIDSANFQLFKDAHFNLMFGDRAKQPIRYKYMLSLAAKVDIKCLICDDRFWGFGSGEDTMYIEDGSGWYKPYSDSVADVIVNYLLSDTNTARQNAWYGFTLYDELPIPYDYGDFTTNLTATKYSNYRQWFTHFRENTENKLMYIKLLPVYAFNEGSWRFPGLAYPTDTMRAIEYEKYLDWFSGNIPLGYPDTTPITLDVMQCDYYHLLDDGRCETFYNWDALRRKSGNRPFWAHVMSMQHFDYLNPRSQHLRHSAFVPIAYGAKGLGWYQYYSDNYDYDHGEAIVTNDPINPGRDVATEKYEKIKMINKYIEEIIGPVAVCSKYFAAYHADTVPTKDNVIDHLINQGSYIIDSVSNNNCMVGILRDITDNSVFYGFIIYKEGGFDTEDLDDPEQVDVWLKGNYLVDLTSSIFSDEYQWVKPTVTYFPINNTTKFTLSLARGEGRMFKISMPENITVSNDTREGSVYEATKNITTDNVIFNNNNIVRSGNAIKLNAGSRIRINQSGSTFKAYIDTVLAQYSGEGGKKSFTNILNRSLTDRPERLDLALTSGNYPNPFKKNTLLKYTIPEKCLVTIKVYNILGRRVKTILSEEKMPGKHQVDFKRGQLSSGIYFYQIEAGDSKIVNKMAIIN